MTTENHSAANAPRPGSLRRPRATDPVEDAIVRREEEFRRFLVSVVAPAFDELRAAFRANGREARSDVTTLPGRPAEATITVSHLGEVEFFCTIHAAITPEQATVRKRRPVPLSIKSKGGAFTEVEDALLNHSEQQSNATAITRADVVTSVRTDYWVLRRSPGTPPRRAHQSRPARVVTDGPSPATRVSARPSRRTGRRGPHLVHRIRFHGGTIREPSTIKRTFRMIVARRAWRCSRAFNALPSSPSRSSSFRPCSTSG